MSKVRQDLEIREKGGEKKGEENFRAFKVNKLEGWKFGKQNSSKLSPEGVARGEIFFFDYHSFNFIVKHTIM